MTRGFMKSGHLPTLIASFLYFDLSFMVWVMLGPLAIFVAKDLGLNAGQKGLMVAVPVLAGAAIRIVAGVASDVFKPLRTGLAMLAIVIAGLLVAWAVGIKSFHGVLALGVVLGVAGASFAVALPLASYWYPREHQGTALGIAGAGNSGTVLAALFAPSLAVAFGWRNVIGLAAIPLGFVIVAFALLAKDSPTAPPRRRFADYLDVLRTGDAWWLMAFYCVTFGGFVGLSSFLPIYFNDQYRLSPVAAGYCTAACVFCGSFARPFGGALADRFGGVKTLTVVYGFVGALIVALASGIADVRAAVPVVALTMVALGVGNGSVFQLVPLRFSRNVGVVTGLVGATGGVGGFYF
ncbi:MAG: MFS transporter, partial [Hyphomicrobiales bacterium]|nr:MFS transporter [Hyphomicrobiales bacterium]